MKNKIQRTNKEENQQKDFMYSYVVIILPVGQGCVLHNCDWPSKVVYDVFPDVCTVIFRSRYWVPPPQVTGHSSHSPHSEYSEEISYKKLTSIKVIFGKLNT